MAEVNFFGGLYGFGDAGAGNYTSSAMQGLDRNAFLSLMVAQMGNQDPLSPMSETESISQLAQFSSLEQMNNMVDSIWDLKIGLALMMNQSLITQGSSMIGKEVSGIIYNEDETEQEITGIVNSVHMKNGLLVLKIGDIELPIDSVREVRNSNQDSVLETQ